MNSPEYRESDQWKSFLQALHDRRGHVLDVSGNQPVVLDDERSVYVVHAGQVDVFAIDVRDGQAASARRHLFRAGHGHGLFGLPPGDHQIRLLVSGTPGTQLLKAPRAVLEEMGHDAESIEAVGLLVDSWVDGLSSGMVRHLLPRLYKALEGDKETALGNGEVARARSSVLWIKHLAGATRFSGRDDIPPLRGEELIPVSVHSWLQSEGPSRLLANQTRTALDQDNLWSGLNQFHALALACIALNAKHNETAESERLETRTRADESRTDVAFSQLASTLLGQRVMNMGAADGQDPLLAACRLVGERLGIVVRPPLHLQTSQRSPLNQIAQASRMRIRQVALSEGWWIGDGGPLLAYIEQDNRPVALLPVSARRYEMHDPLHQAITPVTEEVADTFSPFAYCFYRPFPNRPVALWDIVQFGLKGLRPDLLTIGSMAVLAGLVGMLAPALAGIIFDQIIPGGLRFQLLPIALILVVSAFSIALFQITRNIAILRVEGKLDASIQAAVFDRLLDLPATFFRNYSAGDLGDRTLGVSVIRQTLSRAAISAVFAGVISAFNFVLLFFYNVQLALVAALLVTIFVVITLAVGYIQVRYERTLADIQGKLSGTVLQFINGIAKFRVAGAERRAFAYWAALFAQQRNLAYKTRTVMNGLIAFSAGFSVVTSMILFGMVAGMGESRLSTGSFLAFYFAFSQFLVAALTLSSAFTSTLRVIPIFERAKPILHTLPEADAAKADPGELSGEIEINSVSFRYHADGPLILNDVSIHILPGQFVALVGPSGSGKSTILRLLLGFETADSGGVFYDGQDLTGLDIRAIRRQIGVVLQNGNVMTGDILTNIVGATSLTLSDAWQAARRAGLEEDIRQMPMGMQTVISEGGSTLSGGQRQRLLIARAIVSSPRLIFFDEATSALDNRTQEIISQSLESLDATRVVIAHRLSTVINADQIFVVERGRIVQQGTYKDLVKTEGLFTELARRQLV